MQIRFLILAIFATFVVACSNEPEIVNGVNNNETLVPVRVHVDGFSVTQEDFPDTRAATALTSYTDINAVTLAFYNGATETYKVTQEKGSLAEGETFGNFSLSLPMASYTMVVLAYHTSEGNPLVLTSPTLAAYTGDRSYETFATTQAVNTTNTNAVDISATLDRIVTGLRVVSTDGKTDNVSNVRMTMSAGGMSFNPTTGFATSNTGYVNTVSVSAAVGSTSRSISYFFLTTDEQTMDVTIETLDADGKTLFSKTVKNVPLKRNRVTILTGAMYTVTSLSGSFQVEKTWLDETNVSF